MQTTFRSRHASYTDSRLTDFLEWQICFNGSQDCIRRYHVPLISTALASNAAMFLRSLLSRFSTVIPRPTSQSVSILDCSLALGLMLFLSLCQYSHTPRISLCSFNLPSPYRLRLFCISLCHIFSQVVYGSPIYVTSNVHFHLNNYMYGLHSMLLNRP